MSVLRKLNRNVKTYKDMLINNPELAKKYKNSYLKDIERLTEVNDAFISNTTDDFYRWTLVSVNVFLFPEDNILQIIRKKIGLIISDYCLKNICYKLSKASRLKKSLGEIEKRFNQLNYLT